VISFNRKDSGLSDRFGVVANLLPRPRERMVIHEVRSKETRLDHRDMDPERVGPQSGLALLICRIGSRRYSDSPRESISCGGRRALHG
jgi:hypothetical protein